MQDLFECPECGHTHDQPAHAAYVLTVLCLDCELEAFRRDELSLVLPEVARAA